MKDKMIFKIGNYKNYDLIWTELESVGNKHLLLCNNIIEYLPFHDRYEPVAWDKSALRVWLNNKFYDSAFDETDKRRIIDNVQKNSDHVWLLSAEEAHRYLASDSNIIQLEGPAPYLEPKHIGQYIGIRNRDVWLLRSNAAKGYNLCEISNVIDSSCGWSAISTAHQVNDEGRNLNVNCIAGIRPAIWIKM